MSHLKSLNDYYCNRFIMSQELVQEVKIWRLKDNSPIELSRKRLDFENRLESWLEMDISLLSEDLMVIGRQVPTDYNTTIDLLAIDKEGKLVIIELKRDKTPREITSQVIEYAFWAKDLTNEDIERISEKYFSKHDIQDGLENIFTSKFEIEYPDILNIDHYMYIVGSEIDTTSQRIVKYLNEKGIGINALNFNYFEDEEREYIARTFLIEPNLAEQKYQSKIRRRSKWYPMLNEIGERFLEIYPDSDLQSTKKSYREILTNHNGIHFEWVIFGSSEKKNIDVALHIENRERKEAEEILEKLQPEINLLSEKLGVTIYSGSWSYTGKSRKWRKISIQHSLDSDFDEDIVQWAVDNMSEFYSILSPALNKIKKE